MKFLITFILSSVLAFSQNSQILKLENDGTKNLKLTKVNSIFPEEQPGKKSVFLSAVYSLLLPGMGELYANNYSSGKYFTIAEAGLWATYAGFDIYGTWQQNEYKSFSSSIGGVNTAGKDEDYFAVIGEYQSINDYNNAMLLDRNYNAIYNTNTHYWDWKNSENRKNYRNMWVKSESSFNSLRFIGGLLVVNRIISAINAVRATIAYNKQLKEAGWDIRLEMQNNPTNQLGVNINIIKSF